ncbi:IPTL-CTERM sorting domain-containing protein [Wenzhouxiangella sp. XN79A]|uniref:IPTL-CTERM sorting domain-containing protein n=1 Tax=Wenzhouxiangella sp. XN79A TaxID=2724193 RepID=UPI00144A5C7B|nr:IPTL-CTERM sorting domain-containing protein [Wenzhouxiangella sp. XN79A]NKI36514.1 IPTL-CTERM sorting domain-containing protein [Wenzhouxiangella sp. XN79A]
MTSESFRTTRLHQAVRSALAGMRRPAALASISLATGAGATALPALALDVDLAATTVGSHARQHAGALLVLDAGVENAEVLTRDLPTGVRVARLPADVAPLRGLEMLLEAHPGTRELHVVSHGGPGRLDFAGGAVDADALAASADRLARWFDGVERPEIVLYGCDVAADERGLAFIDALARHTRARISASDDPTGAAASGGDWTLERSTALAARAPLFGEAARSEFEGLLATFTVTDAGDSGPGTLRQAVVDANNTPGADIIEFDAGLSGSTITLSYGELTITDDVSIEGPGAADLTIDGNDNSQIFVITSQAATVSISDLTLTGGFADGSNGGAIESFATSRLTIADSILTGNRAESAYGPVRGDAGRGYYYGGGGNGGAIAQTQGELVITGTTIQNNTAKYDGGGIWFFSNASDDLLQISQSTVTGNVAGDGGGIYYGGGDGGGVHIEVFNYGGAFTVTDSTISSNSASSGGGLALYADSLSTRSYGTGIARGTLTVSTTTIQGNSATRGGGGLFLYGEQDISDIVIEGSQILDNTVETVSPPPLRGGGAGRSVGGGILFANDYGIGGMTVRDTSISGNTAGLGGGIAVVFESFGSDVVVETSTISGNSAIGGPGGPQGGPGYGIGGIGGGVLMFNEESFYDGPPYGSLTVRDTTISANTADLAGGGFGAISRQALNQPVRGVARVADPSRFGGADGSDERRAEARGRGPTLLSEILVEGSTLSGNQALVGGGFAANASGTRGLQLTNSTVSSNSSAFGGSGIELYGVQPYGPVRGGYGLTLSADFLTLANNTSVGVRGGGSAGLSLGYGDLAVLANSVLADNGYDLSGSAEADFTLIENDSLATITGASNIIGSDPLLEPLADNGGPTETHLLGPGSPATDAGDPAFTTPPDFDQRGTGFPRVANGRIDMGATEGLPPSIALAPDPVDFGVVKVGETSAAGAVTISNSGGLLSVSGISAAGGAFAAAGGSCDPVPFDLADGENCTLEFTFTPLAVGVDSLSISVTSNDADGPDQFTLTGEGALGQLSITPDPADFGGVEVNTVSAPLSVTLENIGAVDVDVSAVDAAAAPFAAAGGSCGAAPFSLAPTATCTLDYTFAPVALGPFTQSVNVTSDGSGSPDAFDLTGTGTGGATLGLSTNDLDFGLVSLGVGGSAFVTLTNTGSLDLDINGITDPGAPFSLTFGTRGAALCAAPPFVLSTGASCDIQIDFDPLATGVYTASFDVLSNAPSSPDTVNLEGTAGEPLVIPTLSRWGLVLLGGLMGLLGWFGFRRRETGSTG